MKAKHLKQVLTATNHRDNVPIVQKHVDMFLGEKSLVSLQHDSWKSHRRIIGRAFHWKCLKAMTGDINNLGALFARQLIARNGTVVEMYKASKCVTLDVIGRLSFGYDFKCTSHLETSAVADSLEFMLTDLDRRRFVDSLNPAAYFYWWPNEHNKKYDQAQRVIRGTIQDAISSRRTNLPPSSAQSTEKGTHPPPPSGPEEMPIIEGSTRISDLLTHLLQAQHENPQEFDDSSLEDSLRTFIFAGYDTTSVLLTYLFYIMASRPDVEKKVLEEISRVLGSDCGDGDGGGMPSYESLQGDFPYCSAVINETLRLYAPVPLTSRNLTEPITLQVEVPDGGGAAQRSVTLPTGTMMYIPIWWIHRHESNFERPLEFLPERFLGPQGKSLTTGFGFLPFSGGGRDCVGRRLVILEVLCVFIHAVRAVSFSLLDGYEMVPVAVGTIQRPRDLLPLEIAARKI